MTYEVTLSLGTNIDPEHHMVRAIQSLAGIVGLKAISAVYRTRPVGMEPGADPFHNLCVLIGTDLRPDKLKQSLRMVERDIGRTRPGRSKEAPYEPRRIDIDILTYDPVLDGFDPSPEIEDCGYVVYPLSDLINPPAECSFDSQQAWREACSGEDIIGTVEYDWPRSLSDYSDDRD